MVTSEGGGGGEDGLNLGCAALVPDTVSGKTGLMMMTVHDDTSLEENLSRIFSVKYIDLLKHSCFLVATLKSQIAVIPDPAEGKL